ncbi:unnamed protein product [Closterium sp. Yama58-4]|nr:unnamed protein product [Closterium sp. Yama58-4]
MRLLASPSFTSPFSSFVRSMPLHPPRSHSSNSFMSPLRSPALLHARCSPQCHASTAILAAAPAEHRAFLTRHCLLPSPSVSPTAHPHVPPLRRASSTSLLATLLSDPSPKVRVAAAQTLTAFLDSPLTLTFLHRTAASAPSPAAASAGGARTPGKRAPVRGSGTVESGAGEAAGGEGAAGAAGGDDGVGGGAAVAAVLQQEQDAWTLSLACKLASLLAQCTSYHRLRSSPLLSHILPSALVTRISTLLSPGPLTSSSWSTSMSYSEDGISTASVSTCVKTSYPFPLQALATWVSTFPASAAEPLWPDLFALVTTTLAAPTTPAKPDAASTSAALAATQDRLPSAHPDSSCSLQAESALTDRLHPAALKICIVSFLSLSIASSSHTRSVWQCSHTHAMPTYSSPGALTHRPSSLPESPHPLLPPPLPHQVRLAALTCFLHMPAPTLLYLSHMHDVIFQPMFALAAGESVPAVQAALMKVFGTILLHLMPAQ